MSALEFPCSNLEFTTYVIVKYAIKFDMRESLDLNVLWSITGLGSALNFLMSFQEPPHRNRLAVTWPEMRHMRSCTFVQSVPLRRGRQRFAKCSRRALCAQADDVDWVIVDVSLQGLDEKRYAPFANNMHRDGKRLVFHALKRQPAELSIVLCSDDVMRSLNQGYRAKDRATDVLSFPQNDEVVRCAHCTIL